MHKTPLTVNFGHGDIYSDFIMYNSDGKDEHSCKKAKTNHQTQGVDLEKAYIKCSALTTELGQFSLVTTKAQTL